MAPSTKPHLQAVGLLGAQYLDSPAWHPSQGLQPHLTCCLGLGAGAYGPSSIFPGKVCQCSPSPDGGLPDSAGAGALGSWVPIGLHTGLLRDLRHTGSLTDLPILAMRSWARGWRGGGCVWGRCAAPPSGYFQKAVRASPKVHFPFPMESDLNLTGIPSHLPITIPPTPAPTPFLLPTPSPTLMGTHPHPTEWLPLSAASGSHCSQKKKASTLTACSSCSPCHLPSALQAAPSCLEETPQLWDPPPQP